MSTTRESKFHKGFEFDFMAQRPMYAACPRWLLDHCEVDERSTIVDLGCGSGIFTQYLLDRFPDAPDLRVIAVDPSEFDLNIMKSRVIDDRVTFIQGRAQEIAEVVPPVDVAILCNMLHQIPLVERRPVFEGVFSLLKSGGAVGANTPFYDGGVPADTQEFYTLWMLHARDFLKKRSIALEPPTETPIALQRLSPEQHRELLADTGFVDIEVEEVDCEWSSADWEALSKYSVFIHGALARDIDLSIDRGLYSLETTSRGRPASGYPDGSPEWRTGDAVHGNIDHADLLADRSQAHEPNAAEEEDAHDRRMAILPVPRRRSELER